MASLSLTAQLQALLFVASGPLTVTQLAELTDTDPSEVTRALEELEHSLATTGLRLSHLDAHYSLVTAPEAASLIRHYLQQESRSDLSRPALETLAIVAYRGPLTRTSIEAIRGVSSEAMVRNLLARNLIAEAGKSTEPGRPVLYAVSHTFLQHFGLTSPSDLPPLESTPETPPETEQSAGATKSPANAKEPRHAH